MLKRYLSVLVFLATAALLAVGYGCSGAADSNSFQSGTTGSGTGASSTGSNTGAGGGGGCFLNCGTTGGGGNVQGVIVVSPQNPSLAVVDATIPTQAFTATLNGQDVTASVTWLYERPDIGDMTGALFTPTGQVGGVGKLTAQWNNAEGSTNVTVTVKKTVDGVGVTQPQKDAFDNPQNGPDPSVNIVYPLDQTVFPLAVLGPEIQWNGGAGGDIYRLHIKEKFYEYTEYFMAPPPSRHLMPEVDWQSIENSGSGAQSDPVTFELQRFVNGGAYQPKVQTWHVAQGRLRGSVYYWELPDQCGNGNGRILRIKPDSPTVDQFFQPGGCWGCHTVSRDGTKMMATLDTGSPFPQITVDLTQNPAVYGSLNNTNYATGGTFSAFNDKGDKIVVSNDGDWAGQTRLRIIDSTSGQVLNDNAMGPMCGEAAWSPDGKKMAAICGLTSANWIFDASGGYLATADVAADGVTVTNINQIVPQAGGQGRPAYPSFSPGSEWLAFGRPTQGSRSTGNGDLWIVNAADGSGLKQLTAASGDNRSFNPVFAPLRAGGYFWLVYITRRDYGNTLVGTNRQQIWITAIDDPPTAGDPSHPPFYMRGQENCGKSENAYYALDPCKQVGEGCTSGVDCCNGQCIKDPSTNTYVCGEPPPPGTCSQDGNSCVVDADCCNYPESECIDGFCQQPPPQ